MKVVPAKAHVYVLALVAPQWEGPSPREMTKVPGVYVADPYGALFMPSHMNIAIVEGDPTPMMEKVQETLRDIAKRKSSPRR